MNFSKVLAGDHRIEHRRQHLTLGSAKSWIMRIGGDFDRRTRRNHRYQFEFFLRAIDAQIGYASIGFVAWLGRIRFQILKIRDQGARTATRNGLGKWRGDAKLSQIGIKVALLERIDRRFWRELQGAALYCQTKDVHGKNRRPVFAAVTPDIHARL